MVVLLIYNPSTGDWGQNDQGHHGYRDQDQKQPHTTEAILSCMVISKTVRLFKKNPNPTGAGEIDGSVVERT